MISTDCGGNIRVRLRILIHGFVESFLVRSVAKNDLRSR